MGSGKSWRTSGILYVRDASATSGAARAQSGHSRSSKITIATEAPLGGFRMETLSCATAAVASHRSSRKPASFLCISELDAGSSGHANRRYLYVNRRAPACQPSAGIKGGGFGARRVTEYEKTRCTGTRFRSEQTGQACASVLDFGSCPSLGITQETWKGVELGFWAAASPAVVRLLRTSPRRGL